MAEYASYIYKMRKEYIKKLGFYSKKIMSEISDGKEELSLYYKSDIEEDTSDDNKIKEEYGNKYVDCTKEEAISYFRSIGTEHELEKIKDILNEFRVHFNVWFSETSLYEGNKVVPTIERLKEKGYTYESEGALWFRTTDFGDDKDRVLIKTDGSYTYLTPDIAYHLNKLERGYPTLVDLLGADHHGYIPRLQASVMAFGYPRESVCVDIIQMVRLVERFEVETMDDESRGFGRTVKHQANYQTKIIEHMEVLGGYVLEADEIEECPAFNMELWEEAMEVKKQKEEEMLNGGNEEKPKQVGFGRSNEPKKANKSPKLPF